MKYRVTSESDKNIKYIVEQRGNTWVCECPGFSFRKNECKHIRKVKAFIKQKGGTQ